MTLFSDRLSIRQVEIVDTIARHRSISRAADELNITQSALSHAISTIETQLGIKLFIRQKAGVEPTAFVKPFLARAPVIRDQIGETLRTLDSLTRPKRLTLKIRAGLRSVAIWVTPAIADWSLRFTDYMVDAQTSLHQFQNKIETGETDLAIVPLTLLKNTENLFMEPLGDIDVRYYASISHPLAGRANLTIEDLRSYPLVGDTVPKELTGFVEGDPGALGRFDFATGELIPALYITSIFDMIKIVERSQGITRLPYDVVHDQGNICRMAELDTPSIKGPALKLFAVGLKSKRSSPAIDHFITKMKRAENERPRAQASA